MAESKMVPELRFAGFIEPWEQRKLGHLCSEFKSGDFIKAEDIIDTGPYPVFGGNGLRGYAKRYNHDGDYALIGRQGALCGNMNYSSGRAYFTEHAVAIKANKSNNTRFLFYRFGVMNLGQYSGQSAQPGLAVGNLIELETMIPQKAEQEYISHVLTVIDNFIILHQQKYSKLLALKKSMLEKMFPKADSDVPEIRFAGFTAPWQLHKFSDLADTRRGLTYAPSNIRDSGIRVLRSSNIEEDQFVFGEDDVFVQSDAVNIPYANNGDILITSANGSTRLVGKHAIIRGITEKSAVHGGFMLLAAAKNPEFVNALMSASWYTKFISLHVAGGNGAIGNLNKSDLDEQITLVPTEPEQKMIGQFFKGIDTIINLHRRKYEKLKRLKQALLQKMFV